MSGYLLRMFFRQPMSRVSDDDAAHMSCVLLHLLTHRFPLAMVSTQRQNWHGKFFLPELLDMGHILRDGAVVTDIGIQTSWPLQVTSIGCHIFRGNVVGHNSDSATSEVLYWLF
jgi:hypothetical protein